MTANYTKKIFTLDIRDTDYDLQAIRIIDEVLNDLYKQTGDAKAGQRVINFVRDTWEDVE